MSTPAARTATQPRGAAAAALGVAIVTGAASGIGRATAHQLGRDGYHIAALDLDRSALADAAASLRRQGTAAEEHVVDVCDPGALAAVVGTIAESNGGVRALINNAGIGMAGTVVDTCPEDWERVMATNVTAVYHLCRLVIPHMLNSRGGVIVNVASISGAVVGVPDRAVYCAAKAAVVGLTRAVAADFGDQGIRANAVCPGPVRSPWIDKMAATTPDPAAARASMESRKMAAPDEIAAAISFLASENSSYVNGAALVIDGGLTNV
jgi:NAD(P)-dependent dehydrogenase (short-subunit alcohol dehydrogenase family)